MRSIQALVSSTLVLSVVSLFAGSAEASGAHTRVTNPSAISIEILGRTMLYTIGFDQVVNDNIAVGVGIGTVSTNFRDTDIDTGKSATMIPVYMNYYFLKEAGSMFVTAGATLVTNNSSVKRTETTTGNLVFPSSNVMPTVGVGYENRGDNGFLFRVTGYAVAADKVTPWAGFTFGYSF